MIKCTRIQKNGFIQENFFLEVDTIKQAKEHVNGLCWTNEKESDVWEFCIAGEEEGC